MIPNPVLGQRVSVLVCARDIFGNAENHGLGLLEDRDISVDSQWGIPEKSQEGV